MDLNKKYGGIIQNWYSFGTTVYGNLHNDPQERFEDGSFIHTSKVIKFDQENKKIETLNTLYDLGEPAVLEDLSHDNSTN